MSEIANFKNGNSHENYITNSGKYIVVNSKFISTNGFVKKFTNERLCPVEINDILMVMSDLPNGQALAKCFLVDENEKYTLNQRICCLKNVSENINTKFLFYILNRNKQLLKFDNKVNQTNLKKNDILQIKIPIPPLDVQQKIVDILDKFDAYTSDLTKGLPAEIELRKKQYEYYRDLLLTF